MVPDLRRASATGLVIAAVSALFGGCEKPYATPATPMSDKGGHPTSAGDGEHGHTASARGGILVPIGGDKYHAEAVFEKGGVLRLYTLGKDAASVLEVEAQTLALNPTQAWNALGWKTRLPAREALRWTADWYRAFDAGCDVRALCLAQIEDYEALA